MCMEDVFLLKGVSHLVILYIDRGDWQKSASVPGARIVIVADHHNRHIKLPVSGMSDIGN